jgi:hypothetical protein
VVALLMLLNSFKPLWQRGRPSKASVQAQKTATAPAPVQSASNTTAAPVTRTQTEAEEAASGIELSRVGWSFNGAPRHDPFQVIGPNPSNFARIYPSASELLTLNAVWWQSGSILAAINTNHVVKEGSTMRAAKGGMAVDFKIVNIGVERIWVDGPNGREEVLFDPTLSLRGISVNLGKALDDSFAGAKTHLNWPYRVVDGVTNDVSRDAGWVALAGRVVSKFEEGKYLIKKNPGDALVILKNVPLTRVDEEEMPSVQCKEIGSESYVAANNVKNTVKAYDFGVACSPPKDAIDGLKLQKSFILQQYKEANERRIKFEIQEAEKGDATAQYMLGRRYLYGDGIPKDEQQARHWLEASALQGNPDARSKLQSLALQQ